MPPSIIDIIVKAAGAGFEWLKSSFDIVVTATPMFGVPPFVVIMGFIVLYFGWNLLEER